MTAVTVDATVECTIPDILSDIELKLNAGMTMPRSRRALGKRVRASTSKRLRSVMDRAPDLEEPLYETRQLLQALKMIGDGMSADYDEQGEPIASVARAALLRLDAVEQAWSRLIEAGQRRRAA